MSATELSGEQLAAREELRATIADVLAAMDAVGEAGLDVGSEIMSALDAAGYEIPPAMRMMFG